MSTSKSGTNLNKDVLYIDVDDEITGVIDKVRGSDKKIVALVLPKRATVMQSVVNMKLLKRAADEAKKNLVLITSESSLLPLAGSVGIHVSKSLNSKPEVPDAPARGDDKPETVEEAAIDDEEASLDKDKTVGELVGSAILADQVDDAPDDTETIELDDEEQTVDGATSSRPAKAIKKFKIPNFNKFRMVLLLGGVGLVALIIFAYAAFFVMPKAKIVIKTDSTAVNSSMRLTLKTAQTPLDPEKATMQAQPQEVKKTLTQEVPTTGQQNNGEKAAGSVTVTAKNCSSLATPKDIPAGTGITTNGKTYITKEKVTFNGSGTFDGSCLNFKDTNVAIEAQTAGAAFNVDSAAFAVLGRADATASGSASGGTDDITKVVAQADIDSARQKITDQDEEPIKQELKTALIGRKLYAIDVTFGIGEPETKLSAELNAPAETLTVTQTITYTMLGVNRTDLEKIVATSVADKIDTKKQAILDYGIPNATFTIEGLAAGEAAVTMQTKVVAGAELNATTIKKQVAGKKAGDAKELISANPGVTDVTVEYSPFWVGSIPKKTQKITVIIQEPNVTRDDADSSL